METSEELFDASDALEEWPEPILVVALSVVMTRAVG